MNQFLIIIIIIIIIIIFEWYTIHEVSVWCLVVCVT